MSMTRLEISGRKCAQNLLFQSLGAEAAFSKWSGESVRCHLDGAIRLNAGKLSDINGPSRQSIVDAVLKGYRAKGEEFLKDLSGSFRLALWDAEKQKLLVAVDPFATRPLYFASAKGVLFFAPRISCFSAVPAFEKTIDPNALYFYLNHSFVPAPFTA